MTAPTYLFSYFQGNGEDGLFLASSADGYRWSQIGESSFLRPTIGGGLMRDPCICLGADGMFHMTWTTGWWDTGIGIAHSPDLIDWSEQSYLPVMGHEPSAINAWAPEIFYDDNTGQYLIHWATTIPGRFPETDMTGDLDGTTPCNHRTYYTVTKDFVTYTPAAVLFDDGFNVIDSTLVKTDDRYVLIVKDETLHPQPAKNLRVATASNATGPYGHASAPFSPDWVEGPSVLKLVDRWIVYYDEYTRHKYGAAVTKDFVNWENVTEGVEFPVGVRHGTAIRVAPDVISRLIKARG